MKELAKISQVGTFDKYTIIVEINEIANIPHFHIVGNKFHTCIKIEKAEYLHHSEKDVLNHKEKKELMKFLNSNDKWGEQNWVVLLKEWERNNPNTSIDIKQPIPDYTLL